MFSTSDQGIQPLIAAGRAFARPRHHVDERARWGGAVTPILVFYCLQFMTWRTAFMLFGVLGVVWAIAFFRWYRDDPREHQSVNAAEAASSLVEKTFG